MNLADLSDTGLRARVDTLRQLRARAVLASTYGAPSTEQRGRLDDSADRLSRLVLDAMEELHARRRDVRGA